MHNIVNLTTYRQFTNAARIIVLGLFKEKKEKRKEKSCIKFGLSQFLFLQQKM